MIYRLPPGDEPVDLPTTLWRHGPDCPGLHLTGRAGTLVSRLNLSP